MRIALITALVLLAGCTAEAKLERDIAATLKDPGSAQFGEIEIRGDIACGTVNAKNGFGGYTGAVPFMVKGRDLYMASDASQALGLCCSLHQVQALGEGAAQRLEQCKATLPEPIPLP